MPLLTSLWNALTGQASDQNPLQLTTPPATVRTHPATTSRYQVHAGSDAARSSSPSPKNASKDRTLLKKRAAPPSTPAKRRKLNSDGSHSKVSTGDQKATSIETSRSADSEVAAYNTPEQSDYFADGGPNTDLKTRSLNKESTDGWDDAVDANAKTVVATQVQYETPTKVNHRARAARQRAEIEKLKKLNWRSEDIELYMRIDRRGREPLVPGNWVMDLPTLPLKLFTDKEDRLVIKSLKLPRPNGLGAQSDFRAVYALQSLMYIGSRMRDKIRCKKQPEPFLLRTINSYIKWSLLDAGIYKRQQGWLPVMRVMAHDPRLPFKGISDTMIRKWGRLAQKWRAVLDSETCSAANIENAAPTAIPPLYGIVVSHTILAIVAYAPEEEAEQPAQPHPSDSPTPASNSPQQNPSSPPKPPVKPLRRVATFDFSLAHHDVWNALALALALCHCRNIMVKHVAGRDFRAVEPSVVDDAGEQDDDA